MSGAIQKKDIADIEGLAMDLQKVADSIDNIVKASGKVRPISSLVELNKATKEQTENTAKLTAAEIELAKTQQKLKDIQSGLLDENIKARQALQEATKATKDKIKADQAEEGSLIRKRQKLRELTAEYDRTGTRTKAAAAEINKLSREIGKAEAATNRHSRGVGGYADQLGKFKDITSQLSGTLGNAANSAEGLVTKLGAFGPVGLWIGGTILSIGAPLAAFFLKSEQGVEMLERKTSGFRAAWAVLVGEMITGGEKMASTFDEPNKKAQVFWTTLLQSLNPAWTSLGVKMDIAAIAAENYTRKQQELEDAERGLIVPRAQANLEIKKAMELYNDSSKSIDVRMQGLKDAIDLENRTADAEIEHQRQTVANIKIINAEKQKAGQLRDEDDKKLQDAIATQINLETESVGRTLRANKRLDTARKELLKESEDAKAASNKRLADMDSEITKILDDREKENAQKRIDDVKDRDKAMQDSIQEYEQQSDELAKIGEDELQAWITKEEAKTAKAKEEADKQAEIEQQKAEDIAQIAIDLGTVLGDFASGQIKSFKELSKELLLVALDALQKGILISQVEILKNDIASKGFAGIAFSAVKIALIQAAFTGVKGAIQGFETGTDNAPSTFIAGEKGTELIRTKSGKMILTPNKPTLFSDPLLSGSAIFPHDQTQRILANMAFNQVHDIVDMRKTNDHLSDMKSILKKKEERFTDSKGRTVVKRGTITTYLS